jgi:tetratricopeptide (TPR) repeat protein
MSSNNIKSFDNRTTLECGILLDEADRARFCRDFAAARRYLAQAIEQYPFCAEAYFRKSLLFFESDNKLMKYRCVREAQFCKPNEYFATLCEGYLAEIQGNLDLAASYFEKATHLHNDNPYTNYLYEAYFKLGFIKMDKMDYDGAIACYLRAIEENQKPKDHSRPHITALCFNNIGCCYQDQQRLDLAKEYFEYALNAFPNYVLPRCNIIDICNELGEHEIAVAECKRILTECKDKSTIKFTMMDLLDAQYQSFDFQGAWDTIKQIKKQFPDDYYAYACQSDMEEDFEAKLEAVQEGLEHVRDNIGIAELILCKAIILEDVGETKLSNMYFSLKSAMDKGLLQRID